MAFVTTDCTTCGCRDAFLRRKGNNVGLYCGGCERWYKWLGKKDVDAYKARGFKVHDEKWFPPSSGGPAPEEAYLAPTPQPPYAQDSYPVAPDRTLPTPPASAMSNFDICQVCASGVLEPIGRTHDLHAMIFGGVLTLRNRAQNCEYGSVRVKFCPECGKKL